MVPGPAFAMCQKGRTETGQYWGAAGSGLGGGALLPVGKGLAALCLHLLPLRGKLFPQTDYR